MWVRHSSRDLEEQLDKKIQEPFICCLEGQMNPFAGCKGSPRPLVERLIDLIGACHIYFESYTRAPYYLALASRYTQIILYISLLHSR